MEGSMEESSQLDDEGATWWAGHQSVGMLVLAGMLGVVAVYTLLLRKPGGQLPPGPRPWPILGNLPLLGKIPHQALARLAEKYGPMMYLRLGSTHTIVVSSPKLAEEFLRTQDHVFIHRPKKLASYILHGKCKNLMSSSGPYWRHMRKICTLELLSPRRVESFRPARTEELTATLKAILEESQEGKVVDLNFQLWSLAINNMTRMMLNKRYFGSDVGGWKEAQNFKEIIEKLHHWMGVFIIGDYNPSFRWVSKLQGVDAAMTKMNVELVSFLQHLIEEHRQAATINKKSNTDSPTDFVDVLLSMPKEDGSDNLSDESIRVLILGLLAAGSDTAYITIEWAMAELLRRPDVMQQVQAELDALVGSTRLVEETDLPHLKHLQAVIKETFRLHPPAPLMAPHVSHEACHVAGYNLPAKTSVVVNLWAIGRDPSVWERPLLFEPDRFLQHPEIDVKGQDFQLLPFGSGRRGCPGLSLGLLLVQIALARLLQTFNWSLPQQQDPSTLDMSEHFALTVGRAQPLHVLAQPRLPAHLYS